MYDAVAGPRPGGRRRIDRVLAEGFTRDLAALPLEELRARRADAEQEEADLSYTRRLLQGRLDILRAEASRRAGGDGDTGSLVDRLAAILSDGPRSDHGLGRHLAVQPSRVDEHRRAVEHAVADVGISDVAARSDAELAEDVERLQAMERTVSELRRAVQTVVDALAVEVGRRYADGRADVDTLLQGS